MRTLLLAVLFCGLPALTLADNGRLLATGGASSLEGAAGGGITPWAVLAGYGEAGEWGATAFATRVNSQDYRLDVSGAAVAWGNRLELSYAQLRLDINSLHWPHSSLNQDVFGLKLRLFGDLLYEQLPQVSLGVQYKKQHSVRIHELVGAGRDADTEGYVQASRLLLGGALGYNLLVNGGVRYSRANQLGLLGFGGAANDRREVLAEGSLALLLNPRWMLGVEYRQKPDNLSFAKESDWAALFLGYFPNKHLSLMLAWAQLGDIAGQSNQNGPYLSVQGSF